MRLNGLVASFEEVAKGPLWADFTGFVNHLKSKAEGERFVLLANAPLPGKVEALLQPEHRLEAGDRLSRGSKRLETSDFRHVLLYTEVVALAKGIAASDLTVNKRRVRHDSAICRQASGARAISA